MKKLNDLYPGVGTDIVIRRISCDYKNVEPGDLYVCVVDDNCDGHNYIDEAVSRGASAVVVGIDVKGNVVPTIKVPDTKREFPYLCQKLFDYPDKKMKMIGVTGTDGKTCVSSIIQGLIGSNLCGTIDSNGRSCAAFSHEKESVKLDSYLFYDYLDEFEKLRCKYVVTEANSEVVCRSVFQAVEYDVAVYTNIINNYIGNDIETERYIISKLQMFRQTKKTGFCILNKDDKFFKQVRNACSGNVFTYGLGADNTLQILNFKFYPDKTDITFNYKGNVFSFVSPLLGDFNVYNLAAAMLVCLELGFKLEDLLKNVSGLCVQGRVQILNTRSPYYVMVDNAHNFNVITRLLKFVHTLDINRSIVVIGQAEDKSILNRSQVGEAVLNNATYAIFTSDNSRGEDPENICEDIIKNVKNIKNNYEVIIDRREAIRKAINMANEKDMVLILGRGNDSYQEVNNAKIYFNDVEEAYQAVVNRNIHEE